MEDRRIFRILEDIPRPLVLPWRLAEAGYLPDQRVFHKGKVIDGLYLCVVLRASGKRGETRVNGRIAKPAGIPRLSVLRKGTRLDTVSSGICDEIFFKYTGNSAVWLESLHPESLCFTISDEIADTAAEIKKAILPDPSPESALRLDLLSLRLFGAIRASALREEKKEEVLPEHFQELVAALSMHGRGRLDIGKTAPAYGFSIRSFYRIWEKHFRLSPHEFVENAKLAAAGELLAKTRLSLDEITEKCGFSSAKYMSERFRKRFGCAPGAWRKRENGGFRGL